MSDIAGEKIHIALTGAGNGTTGAYTFVVVPALTYR